ncbi:TRMT1-like protein [Physella acuta]|uniref:TRMT1-like protein n=1 Tax=Physella acuta TaxID=109671 RepID=UPI0027DDA3CD|nr:TRMT1-like protein [Physella acuta]
MINELDTNIVDDFDDKTPKLKAKRYNTKYKLYREFAIATLSALSETKTTENATSQPQISALDALACTGLAGIQWKKHISKDVHVTLADHDDITKLTANAEANSLSCSILKLNPLRTPGDLHGLQGEKEIHICQADAKAVMTMEAFNFIFLNPQKNSTTYFEPAFNSITCRGIVCFIFPDISLFARSPHVVQRYYSANIIKTEYLKELAGRIIIANLAKAAARCNKGISVQYIVSHEDNLLICVKVSRGHSHADSSLTQIAQLLHCRFCEQRIFIEPQLSVLEDPYSLLGCKCKEKHVGKTAVTLGPMWKGSIFDWEFLNLVQKHGKQLKLSSKFLEVTHQLFAECMCSDKVNTNGVVRGGNKSATAQATDTVSNNGDAPSLDSSKDQKEQSEIKQQKDTAEIVNEKDVVVGSAEAQSDQSTGISCIVTDPAPNIHKRKMDDGDEKQEESKRQCKDQSVMMKPQSENVPFYYNINKFKRTNIPKLDKLVTILHCSGHKASRTHFDHSSIRTSASVEEFLSIIG